MTYISYPVSNYHMKSHIFIAMGILIGAIFIWRGIDALKDPGLGLMEVYIFGGFIASGLLIRQGWIDRKSA